MFAAPLHRILIQFAQNFEKPSDSVILQDPLSQEPHSQKNRQLLFCCQERMIFDCFQPFSCSLSEPNARENFETQALVLINFENLRGFLTRGGLGKNLKLEQCIIYNQKTFISKFKTSTIKIIQIFLFTIFRCGLLFVLVRISLAGWTCRTGVFEYRILN